MFNYFYNSQIYNSLYRLLDFSYTSILVEVVTTVRTLRYIGGGGFKQDI